MDNDLTLKAVELLKVSAETLRNVKTLPVDKTAEIKHVITLNLEELRGVE